jgi:hypothetical protein
MESAWVRYVKNPQSDAAFEILDWAVRIFAIKWDSLADARRCAEAAEWNDAGARGDGDGSQTELGLPRNNGHPGDDRSAGDG